MPTRHPNSVVLNYQEEGGFKATMNLSEASHYLGLSIPTVRNLVSKGDLKCKRCGIRYLFTKKILDDWLQVE